MAICFRLLWAIDGNHSWFWVVQEREMQLLFSRYRWPRNMKRGLIIVYYHHDHLQWHWDLKSSEFLWRSKWNDSWWHDCGLLLILMWFSRWIENELSDLELLELVSTFLLIMTFKFILLLAVSNLSFPNVSGIRRRTWLALAFDVGCVLIPRGINIFMNRCMSKHLQATWKWTQACSESFNLSLENNH